MPKVTIQSEDWYVTDVSVEGKEYPVSRVVDVDEGHLDAINALNGITVEDQTEKSKSDLQKRAADLGVEGRSSMTKEELVQAIADAEAEADTESDGNPGVAGGSAPPQPPITAS